MKDFDFRTHIRDVKGRVVKVQPYRQFTSGKYGTRYERPVGSGNCWYANGQPAGRSWQDEKGHWVHDPDAQHVDWHPLKPKEVTEIIDTKDQQIDELQKRIMELEGKAIAKEQSGVEVEKRVEADARVADKKATKKAASAK